MKKNFYALLIIVFLLPGFSLKAETYDPHDLSKLKAFMEQSSEGKRNIDILWEDAPSELAADGSNWLEGVSPFVTWGDGRLLEVNVRYKYLNGIVDFEDCTSLLDLVMRNNNFTSVNVKGCTSLKGLYVCVNKVTSINLEGCNNLRTISASSNEFTTLDVANKSKLEVIYLPYSRLESLDLTGCYSLKELLFTKRGTITSLDLSDCRELVKLECFGNQLTSLDLSHNPKLKKLVLTEKDFTNPITSLNISGCQLLDSYDFIGLLPDLETLNISNCGLDQIDLSANKKLKVLKAGGQKLSVAEQEVVDGRLNLDVLDLSGISVTPSDGGVFADGSILWTDLPVGKGEYAYSFTTPLPAGVTGTPLSGSVTVPWINAGTPVSNVIVEENPVHIHGGNGMLYIRTEIPQTIHVYNLMGVLVKQASKVTDASFTLSRGIYFVQVGDTVVRKTIVR